jgi:predicted acylesterase/phospholipase RssA
LFRVHGWSAEVTFRGLHDAGRPDLIVWSADMDAGQLKNFSFETTPDESVAFALQASMQIPIMYPPLVHKETGHILVDGALIDSMPIWDLGDDIVKNTLALLCRSPPQNPSPRDVIGYVKHLIMTSMDSYKVTILNGQYKDRIINITLPRQFLEINFNLSVDEKRELLDYGYTIAEQWSGSRTILLERRNSI